MYLKVAIFDLDNTLYNYTDAHNVALYKALLYLNSEYYDDLEKTYNQVDKEIKNELRNTAASHNKEIKFKLLHEKLNLNMDSLSECIKVYWDTFMENVKLYNGVKDIIDFFVNNNVKIVILTNYTCQKQIEKLNKLNILDKIDRVITSEETGIEKPSKVMFQKVLFDLDVKPSETIMIGDNFNTDIEGAIDCGIFPFWFNENNNFEKKYIEFDCYNDLLLYFRIIETDTKLLKELCDYCGQRFDLVQAGGGNVSVKTGKVMFIKPSGVHLTETTTKYFTLINNENLKNDVKQNIFKPVTDYNYFGNKTRGSMETYMHSLFDEKIVLHLHPIVVNLVLVQKNAKEIIKHLFPNSLFIEYKTPGVELCKEIQKQRKTENLVFLQNHGIIIAQDTKENAIEQLNFVIEKLTSFTNLDLERYKYTNVIRQKFHNDCIVYFCEDKLVNFYLKKYTCFTFPDQVVYCGKMIYVKTIDDIIESPQIPFIIVIDKLVYIVNKTLKKCKETEEVLKSSLLINEKNLNFLTNENIYDLLNDDSEKYRKNKM